MILRPFLYEETACASYVFGCLTKAKLGVVDPHEDLVERYLEAAERAGAPIVAVFETHVQADHVSGLPALVEATGATAYLPAGASVDFGHAELGDGEAVELGNTLVRALATPGHAPAHNAYVVSDRRRGTDEPWLVFTGDSLLVGDVGRPDLHADGDAYAQYIEETGVAGYRSTPGNRGVWMLRRDVDGKTEFLMFTLWESMDALKAFAGEQPDVAVFYPEDDRFLVERDELVSHWEVARQAGP